MCAEPTEQGPRPDPDDGELMLQLAGGDMKALEAVYMRYGGVARLAIRRTDPRISQEDAEELTQEVFLSLVKSAGSFDSGRALKPWIYGIAVHAAAGRRRSSILHLRLLEKHHLETATLTPLQKENPHGRYEAQESLTRALAALSKEQHEVMILHAVEGFSGEEIAHILGIEVNTVWTRLHRARKILTGILRPGGKETP